jgi:hypothetical protein
MLRKVPDPKEGERWEDEGPGRVRGTSMGHGPSGTDNEHKDHRIRSVRSISTRPNEDQ